MSCPRSFEAEAIRDARIGDAERASFERHAATCRDCAREIRALDELARSLRRSALSGDELHVKRERTRLLAAFDRGLVAPGRPRRALRPAILAAAVLLSIAVLLFWRTRPTRVAVTTAPRPTVTDVTASDSAVWSKRTRGPREELRLERGTLSIRVTHGVAGAVVVVLPDGELEDTGTTFSVAVESGRTMRVSVVEGSVVLRLHGRGERVVRAGETWSLDDAAPPAARAAAIDADAPHPVESARVTAPSRPEPSASAAAAPPSAAAAADTSSPPTPPPVSAEPDPSSDFRLATTALDSGDHARAAAAFARFVTRHPSDPRVEDAAYLQVIALQRTGDRGATRDAAREYLRRHPSGFRRAEVEPLAR